MSQTFYNINNFSGVFTNANPPHLVALFLEESDAFEWARRNLETYGITWEVAEVKHLNSEVAEECM